MAVPHASVCKIAGDAIILFIMNEIAAIFTLGYRPQQSSGAYTFVQSSDSLQ